MVTKDRLQRWKLETSDLIDECEGLERERDEARAWAHYWKSQFWDDHPAAPQAEEPDWLVDKT